MAETNGDVAKTEVANGAGPPPGRGLSGFVSSSMRSIQSASSALMIYVFQKPNLAFNAPFALTAKELGALSNERTHYALGRVLDKASKNMPPATPAEQGELETTCVEMQKLVKRLGTEEGQIDDKTLKSDGHAQDMEMAANALATVILRSKPEEGITNDVANLEFRKEAFGTNAVAPKILDSFLSLCWSAVQDFVMIMLIVLGIIGKLPRQYFLFPFPPPPN